MSRTLPTFFESPEKKTPSPSLMPYPTWSMMCQNIKPGKRRRVTKGKFFTARKTLAMESEEFWVLNWPKLPYKEDLIPPGFPSPKDIFFDDLEDEVFEEEPSPKKAKRS